MTDITPEPILQLATGFMAAKHLFIANEIGLFAALADGPAPLDRLATRTGIARPRVRILADALVTLGLLERHGDQYQNGPVAATFLSGTGPANLGPFLRLWNHISYPLWTQLEDTIRTGQGQQGMTLSAAQERIYLEGVEALMAEPAAALTTAYDFHRHRRVLDLGGGLGAWLGALLRRYPTLEGTLFDLPDAAALARQRLAAEPSSQRAQVVAGDFFTDPIPGGHDAVLIANVMHLYSPAHNLELLRRTRAQVPDGARLLLADWWTDATHTQPPIAALVAGEFLVFSGEGDVYSAEEARGWLHESGWRVVEYTPLAGALSLLVAETAV
jgi:O-methyltransferase domain/Dimerisation domain